MSKLIEVTTIDGDLVLLKSDAIVKVDKIPTGCAIHIVKGTKDERVSVTNSYMYVKSKLTGSNDE